MRRQSIALTCLFSLVLVGTSMELIGKSTSATTVAATTSNRNVSTPYRGRLSADAPSAGSSPSAASPTAAPITAALSIADPTAAAAVNGSAAISTTSSASSGALPCSGDITSQLQAAADRGGLVTIGAGTCDLSAHIAVKAAGTTIEGAGQTQTFLVQTAPGSDIFAIDAPRVTVEKLNLNVAKANPSGPLNVSGCDPSVAPSACHADPAAIYGEQSDTHVIDVTAETGNRLRDPADRPQPRSSDLVTGALVEGVTVSGEGTDGFSDIDVDCQQAALIEDVAVTGGDVTPYMDVTLTLTGLTYTRGIYDKTCERAYQVTGNSRHAVPFVPEGQDIRISNVLTYAGWGRVTNGAVVTVTHETLAPGDTCPAS